MYDLLFLVLFCLISPKVMTGTVSQFPPSVKVKRGEEVTMHCQLNGVRSFCHTVAWVRVHPISGMIDILRKTNLPHQSKNLEENTVCQASIYNMTAQDSGTYYCIVTDREHMHLGNGTTVTVQADSVVMPSVEINAFASSNSYGSTVTLQCTVGGFLPSQVCVYWLIGTTKKNGQNVFVREEGAENWVTTQNYAAVSAEEWRTGGKATCVVKTDEWTFNKTIHHHEILDTCYPLISVTRFSAFVVTLLFFTTSLILARCF